MARRFQSIKSKTQFLQPDQFLEIDFYPTSTGSGRAQALIEFRDPLPDPDPNQPPGGSPKVILDIQRPGGIRIEVFPPGASRPIASMETEDTTGRQPLPELLFNVMQTTPGWKCRFRNLRAGRIVECKLLFPKKLHHTAIPIRVLTNAASQLLTTIVPQIRLRQNRIDIEFSEDVLQFSEGRIKDYVIDLPDFIKIKNPVVLDLTPAISFNLISDNTGKAKLGIELSLDHTTIVELDIPGFNPSGSIGEILVTGDIVFDALRNPAQDERTFSYVVSIDATSDINTTPNVPVLEDRLEDSFTNIVESIVVNTLTSPEAFTTITSFLREGFMRLARQDHELYDISADQENIIIHHFDPNEVPVTVVQPPVIPPTVDDQSLNSDDIANLNKFEHIVVLMMENRSFDHMLGYLSLPTFGGRTDINGLTGEEFNVARDIGITTPIKVNPLSDTVFQFSPNHHYQEGERPSPNFRRPVPDQIADGKMSGFLKSFIETHPVAPPELIMGFYTPDQVSTYDFFANNFLVCNNWFCSHPGPTFPNRFCTLTGRTPSLNNFSINGSEVGYVNLPTLFDHLSAASVDWVYFEHDVSMLRMYNRYRLDNAHIVPFANKEEGFKVRAQKGELPPVTFIEPNITGAPPASQDNDDHPPSDILQGQILLNDIYCTLRKSPQWSKTLFVITYDEHGGFYDHVPPPGTAEADDNRPIAKIHPDGETYYGPRVPAFIISNSVPKGQISDIVFDHTSIAKTILLKWIGRPFPNMGARMQEAAHFGSILTEINPRKDIPDCPPIQINPNPRPPLPLDKKSPDDFHEAIRRFSLPRFPRHQRLNIKTD